MNSFGDMIKKKKTKQFFDDLISGYEILEIELSFMNDEYNTPIHLFYKNGELKRMSLSDWDYYFKEYVESGSIFDIKEKSYSQFINLPKRYDTGKIIYSYKLKDELFRKEKLLNIIDILNKEL